MYFGLFTKFLKFYLNFQLPIFAKFNSNYQIINLLTNFHIE